MKIGRAIYNDRRQIIITDACSFMNYSVLQIDNLITWLRSNIINAGISPQLAALK